MSLRLLISMLMESHLNSGATDQAQNPIHIPGVSIFPFSQYFIDILRVRSLHWCTLETTLALNLLPPVPSS